MEIPGFKGDIKLNELMSRHTSYAIGGPVDVLAYPADRDDAALIMKEIKARKQNFFVLGGGTNLLVSDRGVRGVVLKLGRAFGTIEWHGNGSGTEVRAGAAVPFKKLVTEAAQRSLTGLEFAEGIPGSLGGGVLMNAGAFGGEIAQVIEAIEGVEAVAGPRRLPRDTLRFGYRAFDLPRGFVVSYLSLRLASGDAEAMRAKMREYKRRREAHQPLGYPNAGSIFKNPPGHFAGRLIEEVGLRGRRIGGAMVSQQHANFIVNLGGATAADVRALMDEIARRIWEEKQIRLVPEVRQVGEWGAG